MIIFIYNNKLMTKLSTNQKAQIVALFGECPGWGTEFIIQGFRNQHH